MTPFKLYVGMSLSMLIVYCNRNPYIKNATGRRIYLKTLATETSILSYYTYSPSSHMPILDSYGTIS